MNDNMLRCKSILSIESYYTYSIDLVFGVRGVWLWKSETMTKSNSSDRTTAARGSYSYTYMSSLSQYSVTGHHQRVFLKWLITSCSFHTSYNT